jgi:hypothetical protein
MIPVEMPDIGLTIHEVLGGDKHDLQDLLRLHADLFPHYGYYQPYMQQRAKYPLDADPNLIEHWWLVRIQGEAAGVRFFDYVPRRNCGLGLAVGIKPSFRRAASGPYRRLSELLLMTSLDYLQVDAGAAGKPAPLGMVSEIEDYILATCVEYGYIELPVDYEEPSTIVHSSIVPDGLLEAQELTFRPITLACLPLDRTKFDPANPAMLTEVASALLIDYYGLTEDHPVTRRVLDSIQARRND